jgi:hypothetical protein
MTDGGAQKPQLALRLKGILKSPFDMVVFADSTVSERRDRTMHKEGNVFSEPSASLEVRYTDKP